MTIKKEGFCTGNTTTVRKTSATGVGATLPNSCIQFDMTKGDVQ